VAENVDGPIGPAETVYSPMSEDWVNFTLGWLSYLGCVWVVLHIASSPRVLEADLD
jgi:hypothetical protein